MTKRVQNVAATATANCLDFNLSEGTTMFDTHTPGSTTVPVLKEPDLSSILVVEDHPLLRELYTRVLHGAGFRVDVAASVAEARALLAKRNDHAAVFSDLWLPDGSGLDVIRMLRELQPLTPCMILTGEPTVETAIGAIEGGVHRYLCKPISEDRLASEAREAVRLHAITRMRQRLSPADGGEPSPTYELDRPEYLDDALEHLWLAAQPIVRVSTRTVYAYEVLLRSRSAHFTNPGAVIGSAERQGRVADLGRRVRSVAAERVAGLPEGQRLFVNLHPADVVDPQLGHPDDPLLPYADRVTLEVTERARLDGVLGVDEAVLRLRASGYNIALDDLGSGYSGLTSLANLSPQAVKLDMALVRDLDRDPRRMALVASVAGLCDTLGIEVIAEGVETPAERDALRASGCDLLQGYLFARPGPGYPAIEESAWRQQ